jgi:flagellar basal body-associated protein FliL
MEYVIDFLKIAGSIIAPIAILLVCTVTATAIISWWVNQKHKCTQVKKTDKYTLTKSSKNIHVRG